MRSVPSGSYQRLTSLTALWQAWMACRRTKRRHSAIARFDLDADAKICQLHRELINGRYRPGPHRLRVLCDPKLRLIAAPPIRDRIVHRALLDDIGSTFERSFIDHSFACCRNRGPLRAVLAFHGWQRRHTWVAQLDIRRYFPSVRHDVLLELFCHRVRDRATLQLIESLIRGGNLVYENALAVRVLQLDEFPLAPGSGLPLGGYFSHWSGALYLDGLDHYIKRHLGITAYLRYMDDFALFHEDAEFLADTVARVADWLRRERGLELSGKEPRVHSTREAAAFLGFRVSRSGLSPGRKIRSRLEAKIKAIVAKPDVDKLARMLRSYHGLLTVL